jgi:outer membrane protein insertion porin family
LSTGEYFLATQKVKGNKKVDSKALESTFKQDCNFGSSTFPLSVWIYQIGRSAYNPEDINNKINLINKEFDDKIAKYTGDQKKIASLEKQKNKRISKKKRLLNNGNLMMQWGSKPVLYDSLKTTLTQQTMASYLKYNGYFDATVEPIVTFRGSKAYITYNIVENTPYTIVNKAYKIDDKEIEHIIQNYEKQTFINTGETYKSANLSKERTRI